MFHTNQACSVKPCVVTILWIPKGTHLPQKKGRVSFSLVAGRFAYKSIRLHRGRFAYTTKVVLPTRSVHGLSQFAYIEVDSPTVNTYY